MLVNTEPVAPCQSIVPSVKGKYHNLISPIALSSMIQVIFLVAFPMKSK